MTNLVEEFHALMKKYGVQQDTTTGVWTSEESWQKNPSAGELFWFESRGGSVGLNLPIRINASSLYLKKPSVLALTKRRSLVLHEQCTVNGSIFSIGDRFGPNVLTDAAFFKEDAPFEKLELLLQCHRIRLHDDLKPFSDRADDHRWIELRLGTAEVNKKILAERDVMLDDELIGRIVVMMRQHSIEAVMDELRVRYEFEDVMLYTVIGQMTTAGVKF